MNQSIQYFVLHWPIGFLWAPSCVLFTVWPSGCRGVRGPSTLPFSLCWGPVCFSRSTYYASLTWAGPQNCITCLYMVSMTYGHGLFMPCIHGHFVIYTQRLSMICAHRTIYDLCPWTLTDLCPWGLCSLCAQCLLLMVFIDLLWVVSIGHL